MILKSSEDLAPIVTGVLRQVSSRLRVLLPEADFHHVGSTAIPGALTKGDIDVLLRVDGPAFQNAVAILRNHFPARQPENWDPCFASFGNDAEYALPLGVQLVVKDSEADFFLFVRDHLVSHPKVLADYNRVKLEYADKGADEYWTAKDRFLARILAQRNKRFG